MSGAPASRGAFAPEEGWPKSLAPRRVSKGEAREEAAGHFSAVYTQEVVGSGFVLSVWVRTFYLRNKRKFSGSSKPDTKQEFWGGVSMEAKGQKESLNKE